MKKTIFVGMILFLLNACNSNGDVVRFSTPEDTILVYHSAIEKGDENLAQKCFIKQQHLLEGFSKSLPKNYKRMFKIKSKKIVTAKDVTKMEQRMKENDRKYFQNSDYKEYQTYLIDRDIYEMGGDVRIIVEEYEEYGSESALYEKIYYLRNINGEWKMISLPK
jgi:hypothetical protein